MCLSVIYIFKATTSTDISKFIMAEHGVLMLHNFSLIQSTPIGDHFISVIYARPLYSAVLLQETYNDRAWVFNV